MLQVPRGKGFLFLKLIKDTKEEEMCAYLGVIKVPDPLLCLSKRYSETEAVERCSQVDYGKKALCQSCSICERSVKFGPKVELCMLCYIQTGHRLCSYCMVRFR